MVEMSAPGPETSSTEMLSNQVQILRAELKNIRDKQKELRIFIKKMVTEIESRLTSGIQLSSVAKASIVTNVDPLGEKMCFKPIAFINSCYKSKNGTPRQASVCTASRASLKLEKDVFNNPEHSLDGLQEFSHVWLLFVFHQNYSGPNTIKAKVSLPRMDGKTAGVFATRSPHRPCPIGLSLTKLDKIEGDTLYLSGVDLIHGTPILDIKPYIPTYDNPENMKLSSPQNSDLLPIESKTDSTNQVSKDNSVTIASWLSTPKVTLLTVSFTERADKEMLLFHSHFSHKEKCKHCLEFLRDAIEIKSAIKDILREDPRSVYRRNKCTDRLYYFTLDTVHVSCWFDEYDPIAEVLRIKPVADVIQ